MRPMLICVVLLAAFVVAESISISTSIHKLPGDDLRLHGRIQRECVVTGQKNLRYNIYWKLPNGEKLRNRYLDINNLQQKHFGTYTCVAEVGEANDYGMSSTSFEFRSGTDSNNIRILIHSDDDLRPNGRIRRKCVVSGPGSWRYIIYWILPNGGRLGNKFLNVYYLQPRHLGKYTCYAETIDKKRLKKSFVFRREGGSGTTTPTTTRGTTTPTATRGTTPHCVSPSLAIWISPSESLGPNGTMQRLCVPSHQGWNIYWTFPNGSRTIGQQLTIHNPTQRNSGLYTCHAVKNGCASVITTHVVKIP